MKRYEEFLNKFNLHQENTNHSSLEDKWFGALKFGNINRVKKMIEDGIDINMENDYQFNALTIAAGNNNIEIVKLLLAQPELDINAVLRYGDTALLFSLYEKSYDIVKLLIQHPEIDITIVNEDDVNFIILLSNMKDKSFLKDYHIQKKILENGREDIILSLNSIGVIDERIKEENPELFKAADWGLI